MLVYENDGFLEVESKDIKQLCRSTASVTFGDAERLTFEIRAVLCSYMDNSEQLCRVAFDSKALKVSLVFTVKGPENQTSWEHAQEVLALLGFKLEDVNLRLSPAMLEVILRDLPGLRSPAEARKEKTNKALLLAELKDSYDKAPDSVQGKKAALRLSAEMRLGGYAKGLRLLLERSLSSAGIEALAGKVKDLTSRLEAAESFAKTESAQRQMSETIRASAEKRIQELETLLVDVETKSSVSFKQKRKIVQLQGQIKQLEQALASADAEVENELDKQGQLIAEKTLAHERISLLEDQLKKAETTLATGQSQLTMAQAEGSRLNESLKDAELRIKALDAGLKSSEKEAAQRDEAVKATEVVQAKLVEVQQELKESLHKNIALEEELAAAIDQSEGLAASLQESESLVSRERAQAEAQSAVLTEQKDQLVSELTSLRDEFDQKGRACEQLEEKLAAALEQNEGLAASLQESEKLVSSERAQAEAQSAALTEQKEQLVSELTSLRDEFDQKGRACEQLEEKLGAALEQNEGLTAGLQESKTLVSSERALAEEQSAALTEQKDQLASELNGLRSEFEQKCMTCEELEEKLGAALEQNEGLAAGLQKTEKLVSDTTLDEAQSAALTEQKDQLASELNSLRSEFEQKCMTCEELEQKLVEEGRNISTLEDSLAKMTAKTSGLFEYVKKSAALSREIETLRIDFQDQKQRLQEERSSREKSEAAIEEAHKVIGSLEHIIRETERNATEQSYHEISGAGENQKKLELWLKLDAVESQLEQERIEQKRLLKAVAAAEKKIVEHGEMLARVQAKPVERELRDAVAVENAAQVKSNKPLPHELRPEPKKGALFRPDWDLAGLPCQSSKQVLKAWETVFNVQISLEGYQSQYCMAFLVVLRLEKQKKLYLLYRLKKDKHTLVCVPVKTPKDETSLAKAIKQVLHFLKISGFGMEPMSRVDIDNTLRPYFLEN